MKKNGAERGGSSSNSERWEPERAGGIAGSPKLDQTGSAKPLVDFRITTSNHFKLQSPA